MAKFVKTSMKGWDYAKAHPDDAVKIILDNDSSGAQTEEHQKRMMEEVSKLLAKDDGRLDPSDFDRTVSVLLTSSDTSPVITKKPAGAWTAKIEQAERK